jgi:hypothetical protein
VLGFMHLKRIFSRSSLQQTLSVRAWQPLVQAWSSRAEDGGSGAREASDEALTLRPLDSQRGSDNHLGIRLQCLQHRSKTQDQPC